MCNYIIFFFFFSSRRRHTRLQGDWSSDVCSSDLLGSPFPLPGTSELSGGGEDGGQEAEGAHGGVEGAGGPGGAEGGQDGGRAGQPAPGPSDPEPHLEEATPCRRRGGLRQGRQKGHGRRRGRTGPA